MIEDFLSFRRMLTPWLIIVFFWVGISICLVASIYDMFHGQVLKGVAILLFGPIVIRILCESSIIFFRINETLMDIRNKPSFRM